MKIICFGDSLTSCGGFDGRYSDILQDRFPEHTFINKGVGGETFVDGRARLQKDVLRYKPDVVLIEFGANDWWRNERPYVDWGKDLTDIIIRVQQAGGRAVVLGIFGHYRNEAGQLVPKVYGTDERATGYQILESTIAARNGCPYVANIQENIINRRRCWTDSNHPNEYGNRSVADMIQPILENLLQTKALPIREPDLETTLDFWHEAIALAPRHLAVVDGDRRLSYAVADERVQKLADGLYAQTGNIRPKVAVYLPNCLEYYLMYWAVQRLGGVIVPLNTWLKEDSLADIFQSVQPDLLLVQGAQDVAAIQAVEAHSPRTAVVALTPSGRLKPWKRLFKAQAPAPQVAVKGSDLSIIMHTSGTTSAPKGAMMRHSDLMFNVTAAINAHEFSPLDVHLLVNPMFHCTALYSSLPTAAYQKTPVIITASTDPQELMALVKKEKITTFLSVPAVFQKILTLKDLTRDTWESLRLMAYAGSPMPVQAVHELRKRFPGVALHNFFGLTETISMTHVLRNEDVESHPDSIGKLLPFVEARIVDEHNRQAKPDKVGELIFARDEVICGYYNQPDKLKESLCWIDGRNWFRTGDLSVVDPEGFFTIKGRKKDMVIVGGENVFASEVEAVLMTHPDIVDCAVKGVAATGVRSHLGELVKAYVVRRNRDITELDVRRHCHDKLPPYKVPSFVVFVENLPRNPAGKVVKSELE